MEQKTKESEDFNFSELVSKYNKLSTAEKHSDPPSQTSLDVELVQKYNKIAENVSMKQKDADPEQRERVMQSTILSSIVPGITTPSGKNFQSPSAPMSVKELVEEAKLEKQLLMSRICIFEFHGKTYTVCIPVAFNYYKLQTSKHLKYHVHLLV